MIVVAIIAVLAGILIPNFVNARAQAQTAACQSNLRAIATALELYYADNQKYPPSGNAVPDAIKAGSVFYLNNTPKDPASEDPTAKYSFTAVDATGGAPSSYTVTCPGTHVGATLAKIAPQGKTDGTVCGAACTATKLLYVAGQGLQAAP